MSKNSNYVIIGLLVMILGAILYFNWDKLPFNKNKKVPPNNNDDIDPNEDINHDPEQQLATNKSDQVTDKVTIQVTDQVEQETYSSNIKEDTINKNAVSALEFTNIPKKKPLGRPRKNNNKK